MQNLIIPDGLELFTDSNVTRLFPLLDNTEQQTFSFMPEKKKVKSLYIKETEQLGLLTRLKRMNFAVFDENGNEIGRASCRERV